MASGERECRFCGYRTGPPQIDDKSCLRPLTVPSSCVRKRKNTNSHVTARHETDFHAEPNIRIPQVVVYMPYLEQDVVEKKNRIGFAEWLGLPTLRPNAPWHSCLFETGAIRRVSWSPVHHGFGCTVKDVTIDVLAEAARCNRRVIHTWLPAP